MTPPGPGIYFLIDPLVLDRMTLNGMDETFRANPLPRPKIQDFFRAERPRPTTRTNHNSEVPLPR